MPKWGMVIELNRCTGCGSCVTSCRLENNIPNAGPKGAQEGRNFMWMDMLQVNEGVYPDVHVRLTSRPCFQCDNPPCTRVCPVRATYLNEEGLVAQVYHRCIGCRY